MHCILIYISCLFSCLILKKKMKNKRNILKKKSTKKVAIYIQRINIYVFYSGERRKMQMTPSAVS